MAYLRKDWFRDSVTPVQKRLQKVQKRSNRLTFINLKSQNRIVLNNGWILLHGSPEFDLSYMFVR